MNANSSPDAHLELSQESRRLFARTAELVSRPIVAYQELDALVRSSGRAMHEWIAIARQLGGTSGEWMASQLAAIEASRERIERLRRAEPSRPAFQNKIPSMRLVRRV